jgi:hypothetical protein
VSDGKSIYGAVKAQAVQVNDLPRTELRELMGHLARKGKVTGTAGRIWGEALAELAVRFMAEKPEARDQKPEADEGTAALTDFIKTDPDA